MKEIKRGDWIEVTFVSQDCVKEVKVLGLNEKGIEIYDFDEWDNFLIEWKEIDSVKVIER
tara:strand:- start:24 stop:203 length:180 start_codon:yes stop_codon:yes gene_type:complete